MPGDNRAVVDAVAELERGREAYPADAWSDAYESLSAADRADLLGPEDLELLAGSAYMLGREAEYLDLLERAHRAHLRGDQPLAALRCAFWIGVHLASRGRDREGKWVARSRPAVAGRAWAGSRRAWIPLASGRLRARGEWGPRRRRRDGQ
jgi:hypothetical protein